MGAREFLERLTGANRVYGEPYEKDGVTVIPVSLIKAGGGFGSGASHDSKESGEGGGGGVVARPVGAYVIRDGHVRWEPALDITRIAIGAQILIGLVLLAALRRRRKK
ncbi:sporulation protein [Streptosporangiaceae bacterium NEAU-GS5]|nr:sporulation protein [Streptosporangiaceae bacterium NEAU-GS5]